MLRKLLDIERDKARRALEFAAKAFDAEPCPKTANEWADAIDWNFRIDSAWKTLFGSSPGGDETIG
jgi:hypothetical protein